MLKINLICCVIFGVFLSTNGATLPDTLPPFKSVPIDQVSSSSEILPTNIVNGTFTTFLDHNNPTTYVNFTYQANLGFYQPGGPIYIYVKDIGDYTTQWIERGLMLDIAASTGGGLFTYDHRYFGQNIPVQNLTLSNLQHLTIEQILADIATFAISLRYDLNTPNANVTVWGSGIGATFAAWSRLRYPTVIESVWSSSGIFELQVDTPYYYNTLNYAITVTAGPQCSDRLAEAFSQLDTLIRNGEGHRIQEILYLCNPVETSSAPDVAALFEIYYDYISTYFNLFQTHAVLNFCHDLNAIQYDALRSLARWAEHVFRPFSNCLNHSYNNTVNIFSDVTAFYGGRRQWYYLQCTDAGLFKTTTEYGFLPDRIHLLDYHIRSCNDILGPGYNSTALWDAVNRNRIRYGTDGTGISNVVYTNGYLDGFFFNGILYSYEQNATVQSINLAFKSADLSQFQPWDTVYVMQAKQTVYDIINSFTLPRGNTKK